MFRRGFTSVLTAAALLFSACSKEPPGAAETAQTLLAAAVAGDRVALEALIDRPAVRDDLRRQMVDLGHQAGLEVDGGPSEFVLDRMIGPDAIKLVRAGTGEPLAAAPSADEVKPLIKSLGTGRACLKDPDDEARCLLTFARSKAGWRLVGMQAMDLTIPVA